MPFMAWRRLRSGGGKEVVLSPSSRPLLPPPLTARPGHAPSASTLACFPRPQRCAQAGRRGHPLPPAPLQPPLVLALDGWRPPGPVAGPCLGLGSLRPQHASGPHTRPNSPAPLTCQPSWPALGGLHVREGESHPGPGLMVLVAMGPLGRGRGSGAAAAGRAGATTADEACDGTRTGTSLSEPIPPRYRRRTLYYRAQAPGWPPRASRRPPLTPGPSALAFRAKRGKGFRQQTQTQAGGMRGPATSPWHGQPSLPPCLASAIRAVAAPMGTWSAARSGAPHPCVKHA